jgi:hypothetical protein
MNDIVILNETTLDNVKETYKGDLLLFNHYPIKDLNQIINKDEVKYIIHSKKEDIYIVITKITYNEIINR